MAIMNKFAAMRWQIALAVVVILLAVAAPFWNVPLNRDQGVYATCADVLLRGGVPYRDCWDTKGPALHYTYAIAQVIFNHFTGGAYVLNALAIALTALVIAAIARNWFARIELAYGVGLIYGLMAIAVRFDMNAQPESFANLFAMLGMLSISMEMKSRRWLLVSGIFLAIAVFYKYALAMPYGVAALALIALHPEGHTLRNRLQAFMWIAGGALASTSIFALYLLVMGAFDDALLHLRFILFYFPQAQLNPNEFAQRSKPMEQTLQYLARLPIAWGAALIGAIASITKRRWYGWVILAYLIASVVVVWGQQRFTPYHWTVGLPAVALGIGALLHEVLSMPQPRFRYAAATLISLAVLVNIVHFFYVDQWLIMGNYITGAETRQQFFETHGTWDHAVAADYIRERTQPDDPIWVWGHHTAIYFLADRPTPTRFIYNEPLLMRLRIDNPYQAEWRADLLNDLYANPPVYLLLTTFDRTFFDFQNPNMAWEQIPEYNYLTQTYYLHEYDFGRFQFWRLKPYWDRRSEDELLDEVTVKDLIADFDQAAIENQPDPPIDVMSYVLPAEQSYDAIRIPAGGRLQYHVELPSAPICLRFDAAMFPDSWFWGGDGATFAVSVIDEAGSTNKLFEQHISNAAEDQRWHPTLIDLSAYGEQQVRIVLENGPGPAGDFVGDWAGWGTPRIVRPPSGDQCDSNAIVDSR